MNYVVASEKSWHKALVEKLQSSLPGNWVLIDKKEDFTADKLSEIKPQKIFLPIWSYIIPAQIFSNFETIVFHMTDLPYGRGGSPLQNLIVRGHSSTKISALKVIKELDAGDVYLKKDLSLEGSAQEIFIRANEILAEMIIEIIQNDLKPSPQVGEPILFTRRKPHESNIAALKDIRQIYDYIRMLDAEGYPNAFLETDSFRFEFQNASIDNGNIVNANVRIIKK